jgi:multiple sugar transport system ATP-binding protein
MSEIVLTGVRKEYVPGVDAVADVHLEIASGEFVVLVGPSGCGKSTLLRMIAGVEQITEGRVEIGGRDVTAWSARDRDVAMVFQTYALYPHMTVRRNLGYGLRVRRIPKAEIARRVEQVAKLVGLEELLDRKPRELSGGERQRVAMGRAIVREPQAFFMDEPLSNLDAKLRVQMRSELAQLHARLGVTTVYVTHDQVEAMTLGQRVAVMLKGRIQQVAPPQQLYHSPTNLFVATFIGSPAMNTIDAEVRDGAVHFGAVSIALDPAFAPERDGPVILGIRPNDLEHDVLTTGSDGAIEAEVAVVEDLGYETHLAFTLERRAGEERLLSGETQRLLSAVVNPRVPVRRGDRVRLAVDANRLYFFDPETNQNLAPPTPRAFGEPFAKRT